MDASFFARNRTSLANALDGGLIVVCAYGRLQRSNDNAHAFTQESNFWYLCGIEEPDWMLIVDGSAHKSWLVVPDIDAVHQTFDGSYTPEEAKRRSGVDKVITSDESDSLLRSLAKRHSVVWTVNQPPHAEFFNFSLNPSIAKHKHRLERIFGQVQDCRKDLAMLRAVKQEDEVRMIQKAIDVTVKSFEEVKANLSTYKNEYEIEAKFTYTMRMNGASGHAYDPIIAAGANACTLHYMKNRAKLKPREFVLMDVGASYGGYAADITRTFAKGEPTKRQRAVHQAVEAAHLQTILLLSPSKSVEAYQNEVEAIMKEALASLNLSHDEAGLRRYFPHAISHGLGIDVHDSLGAPKHFAEGMVLTVEPGIYIPEENIGVRIEDDILITGTGRKNLSARLSTGP